MLLLVPKLPYHPVCRSTDVWLVIPSKIFIFLWIYSFLNVIFCFIHLIQRSWCDVFCWPLSWPTILSVHLSHSVNMWIWQRFLFFFYSILGNSQKWAVKFYSNFELVRENRGKSITEFPVNKSQSRRKRREKVLFLDGKISVPWNIV